MVQDSITALENNFGRQNDSVRKLRAMLLEANGQYTPAFNIYGNLIEANATNSVLNIHKRNSHISGCNEEANSNIQSDRCQNGSNSAAQCVS